MDIFTLRTALPAFQNTARYPDDTITYWLGIATGRLNAALWGANTEEGLLYLTAHLVEMAARSGGAGGAGSGGIVASKSVGPASVSYNTTLGTVEGAGVYNLTPWGRQYYQMARLIGAGGLQLNPPAYGGGPNGSLLSLPGYGRVLY